jgi:predicted lipoprotein with Yx(FWY)xxD motif
MRMGTRIKGPGRLSRRNSRWLVAGALGLIALVAAACGSSGAATTASKAPSVANAKSSAPVSVTTAKNSKLGTILVDQAGLTLYTYTSDSKNMSTCTGACATEWPPLTLPAGTTKASAGPGVTASKLGTFTRPGGVVQVTFGGMPLYRFSSDTMPGQANGQGVEGKWFVVSATGAPVTASTPSTPATSSAVPSTTSTPAAAPPVAPSGQMGSPAPATAPAATTPPATAPPATAPPTTAPPATAPPATAPPATAPPTTTPTTQPAGGGYGY